MIVFDIVHVFNFMTSLDSHLNYSIYILIYNSIKSNKKKEFIVHLALTNHKESFLVHSLTFRRDGVESWTWREEGGEERTRDFFVVEVQ